MPRDPDKVRANRQRELAKRKTPEHRQYEAAKQAAWRKKNPDKERVAQARQHAKRSKDPEYRKRKTNAAIARSLGVSIAAVTELRQMGTHCPICSEEYGTTRMTTRCIDHDHETGKVRGVICGACNSLLGCARDKINTLAAAIRYLNGEIGRVHCQQSLEK